MSNGHGGRRPGAGRPRTSERYAAQIESFLDQAAAGLAQNYATLERLAAGNLEQVEEEYQPAGLIYVRRPVLDPAGVPRIDANGRPIMANQLAFPDLPPNQPVLVRRRIGRTAPNPTVLMYLVNRVLGMPTAAIEGEVDLNDPDQLVRRFEAAVEKVYGDEDEPSG
ncbi:MAG TPA: hypothetical protein VFS21_29805 [Roseiflexaceae bacterium]|nr:hypothetical protein [Roseiflexaceae bacterium]